MILFQTPTTASQTFNEQKHKDRKFRVCKYAYIYAVCVMKEIAFSLCVK